MLARPYSASRWHLIWRGLHRRDGGGVTGCGKPPMSGVTGDDGRRGVSTGGVTVCGGWRL